MKLIEADKALKIAESYGTTHGTSLGRHSGIADTIYDEIAKLPTIEAEPVRHGEWTPINLYCNHAREFKCSACGESVYYDYYTRFCEYVYCPNCGAKMDGGDNS